jgi:plastocyanin
MSRTPVVLLVLIAVLALAGCSKQEPEFVANDQVPAEQRTTEAPTPGAGGEQPPAQVQGTWVVEGAELAYDQTPATLPAGNVTIQLQNIAGLQHDVTFEGVRNEKPIVEVNGRGTDTGTVELNAGTYTYYCSVPGHREAGMEGTVTVQ